MSVHREVREECLDVRFRWEESVAGPHTVETDVAHDPLQVGSLGMNRVVVQAEHLSDLIEKFWRLTAGRARLIMASVNDALQGLITGIGQNCLKTPPLSHYQGKNASQSMVRAASPRERGVARLRQAERSVRSATPREPTVRPDFLPWQSAAIAPIARAKSRSTPR